MVYDEGRADRAGTGKARLVTTDGNGEGLCRYWPAILFKFCAYDWDACEHGGGRGGREWDVLPSTRTGVRPR